MRDLWKKLLMIRMIARHMEQHADILAETPKSVSGMTRIYEPQIKRDFPDFSLDEFANRAENALVSALAAVNAGDASALVDVSEELRRQVENQISVNKQSGVREVYTEIKVHQTEVTNYQKKKGTCVITFQSAVEHFHYKDKGGRLIEGDKQRKTQTKYNTEFMYIQDERLVDADEAAVGTTCPNCGAPINQLGNMYCEYCGLAITPINLKVWTLHRYYEVDYRHV